MTKKLAIVLRSLETGGAEKQALELAKNINKKDFTIKIISFYSNGSLIQEANNSGIEVVLLNKSGRYDIFGFLFKLKKELDDYKPDLVHTFLDSPNIILGIFKLFGFQFSLIWGIRSSQMELSEYNFFRKISSKLEIFFSKVPTKIICNSFAGKKYIISKGFPEKKCLVVHNGIDSKKFMNISSNKEELRKKFNLPREKFLIGLIARADPKKDHLNFIAAANIAVKINKNFSFVIVTNMKKSILNAVKSFNLHDNFFILPQQNNISEIYHTLDINTLSSAFGEGFPNVVAESMVSGCPTVSTDTGDSKFVLGNSDLIVPPKNPQALANVWLKIYNLNYVNKCQIIEESQNRIVSKFSTEIMISKISNIYKECIKDNLSD